MGINALFAEKTNAAPFVYVGVAVVLFILLYCVSVVLLCKRYKRCPSNRILVVYGKHNDHSIRCIHGGAKFILPLLEDYAWLSLDPIRIEIPLKRLFSSENVRDNGMWAFTVAIGTDPEMMHNAAMRLVGLTTNDIKQHAEDIITGQLYQLIASKRVPGVLDGYNNFLDTLKNALEPELHKIGLALTNMNIPPNLLPSEGR